MNVEIDGRCFRLEQQHLIGSGGEGMVFLALLAGRKLAVKIYHHPTPQRQEKLLAFLGQRWRLPLAKIALPLQVVREPGGGAVIGLTMPFMEADCEEVARLANKKHRTSLQISTRQVAQIFLDGAETLHAIHRSGLVVGDLNDHNILYRRETMLWLDVDAWQFAAFPCPVATEDFLAPDLYNLDLSARPVFKPEHDWYAYAVHLFRSLLLAHPYGGTHTTVPLLTQRAQQRIFALDQSVTYPKIAYTPLLLSDELLSSFDSIFAGGKRGPFPVDHLRRYHDELRDCLSCHAQYPASRGTCPLCKKTVAAPAAQSLQPLVSASGVHVAELLRTGGKLVLARVQGGTLYAIAHEQEQVVLYTIQPGSKPARRALVQAQPGTRYDLLGHMLICNPFGGTELICIDTISGKELCRGETAIYAASRQAMFQASGSHLYSIVNNALMYNEITHGEIMGRPLRAVMERQTWFSAAHSVDQPGVFGLFQVFRQYLYWVMHGHAVYDVALEPLHDDEAQLDIAAYFAGPSILVRRHTQQRGIDYLRTELLDLRGHVVHRSPRQKRAALPTPHLHGLAYAPGTLLHATDQGIVQEKVEQGSYKTFAATRSHVQEGDILEPYQAGLLVIGEQHIAHLVM